MKAAAAIKRGEVKAELDALHAMEIQSGERIYSGKIEVYDRYAKKLLDRVHLDEKHGVPDSSRTRYEWQGIRSASLGVVIRSDFSPAAPSEP